MKFIKKIILCLFWSVSVASFGYASAAVRGPTILKVGLIEGGREPYYWKNAEAHIPEGFYIDLMKAVSAETDIKFDYRFAPQARIRMYMKLGLLNFEPGIAESWRQEPEEVENSVYSEPFLLLEEVIVSRFKLDFTPLSLQELAPAKVCQVLGFSGADTRGHEEVVVINDLQALRMLARGRCDYAVMPLDVARYLTTKNNIDLKFSKPLTHFPLSLRLDRQYADLLPGINRALNMLWETGAMDSMLKRYQIQSMVMN